jgi:hypothetical protein
MSAKDNLKERWDSLPTWSAKPEAVELPLSQGVSTNQDAYPITSAAIRGLSPGKGLTLHSRDIWRRGIPELASPLSG